MRTVYALLTGAAAALCAAMRGVFSLRRLKKGDGGRARDVGRVFGLGSIAALVVALSTVYVPCSARAQGAGRALDFDGTSDYVNVGSGSSIDNLGPMTVSFWLYARNTLAGQTIWYKKVNDGIQQRGSGLLGWTRDTTSDTHLRRITGTGFIAADQWLHIAFTWDGTLNASGVHFYKNGVEASSYSINRDGEGSLTDDAANDLTIGARIDGASPSNAIIDEVRIWNDVRTETEIRDWMHKTEGLTDETGLVSVWHFDESTVGSNSAVDSKSGNDGTPTNMGDEDCITSTAPSGTMGKFVVTTEETSVGPAGGLIKTTITSVPSDANNLGVYQFGSLSGDPVTSGETFPGGFDKRSNIVWGITERGDVTATLVFDYGNQPGISDAETTDILKRTDANDTSWELVTESSRDNEAKTITITGVSSFSEYALGAGPDNSLPVELSSFTAAAGDGQVTLEWVTESEVDNLGFHVYRALEEEGLYERVTSEMIEGAGTATNSRDYAFTECRLTNGVTYWYKLEDIAFDGTRTMHGPISVAMEAKALPAEFALSQNFPNPFNSATIVKYRLPEESYVSLSVYNTQGQLVRTLVESRQEPGYKSVRWDGGDESNREVAAGIYLYHIQAGKFSQARRMLLLK